MNRNQKRNKILLILLALLLSLVQTASAAPGAPPDLPVQAQTAAQASPGAPSKVFLPLLPERYPFTSPLGIDLGPITVENGLNEMVQAGAQWVRRGNYFWPLVEPNKGDRNWEAMASFESELAAASANGLYTILVVQNTPAWARQVSNSPCGPVKPDELPAFASFMHDLVARYSQPPYNVKYWEIFNEPDAPISTADYGYGCWGDRSDANYGGHYYGEMLKVIYPQIKAADPDAQVVLGGLLLDCDPLNPPENKDCKSSKFLEGVLSNGGASSFDIVSFHTYDYYYGALGRYGNENWNAGWDSSGPAGSAKLAYLRDLLLRYNAGSKPVMATEVALLCSQNCDQDFELTKAAFVTQSYAYAAINNLQAGVWYDVFGSWRSNGLLNPDRTPLPAYTAYQFAHNQIGDASYTREVTGYPGAKVFEFDRGDRRIWLLWSIQEDAQQITLPSTPLAAWDVLGRPLPAEGMLNLGSLPVYLEWEW